MHTHSLFEHLLGIAAIDLLITCDEPLQPHERSTFGRHRTRAQCCIVIGSDAIYIVRATLLQAPRISEYLGEDGVIFCQIVLSIIQISRNPEALVERIVIQRLPACNERSNAFKYPVASILTSPTLLTIEVKST